MIENNKKMIYFREFADLTKDSAIISESTDNSPAAKEQLDTSWKALQEFIAHQEQAPRVPERVEKAKTLIQGAIAFSDENEVGVCIAETPTSLLIQFSFDFHIISGHEMKELSKLMEDCEDITFSLLPSKPYGIGIELNYKLT